MSTKSNPTLYDVLIELAQRQTTDNLESTERMARALERDFPAQIIGGLLVELVMQQRRTADAMEVQALLLRSLMNPHSTAPDLKVRIGGELTHENW